MPELVLSGGYFGEAQASPAPPSWTGRAVHGGYFGGVPKGVSGSAPGGWSTAESDVRIDVLRTFGTQTEYQPLNGGPFEVAHGAIYRQEHVEVEPGTGAQISSTQPVAAVHASEVPEAWTDEDLVVTTDRRGRARLFRLVDQQPDGEVGARLIMHEVER